MADDKLIEQLDEAVEAIMADPKASPPVSLQLAELLRIASDLRDLPRQSFKARLKARLLSQAAGASLGPLPDYGKPLRSEAEIIERMGQIGSGPSFSAYDLATGLKSLPDSTMRFFTPLNQCLIGVSRGTEVSHWEVHWDGDELLYFLEGEADIVTLTRAGEVRSTVGAGSLFVCPQALWHRVEPRSPMTMFFATPGDTEGVVEDPRSRPVDANRPQPATTPEQPCDLKAILADLPVLRISDSTTEEEANASFRNVARVNQCTIGLSRFTGTTPWERHPGGDELLYALEGDVEITVLADDGPRQNVIGAGSVFVCPRGLWHRQRALPFVTTLYGTPTETSEFSFADDPRIKG